MDISAGAELTIKGLPSKGLTLHAFVYGRNEAKGNVVKSAGLRRIRVAAMAGDPTRGHLQAGNLVFPVALGRSGILTNKREGDGATPRGTPVYNVAQFVLQPLFGKPYTVLEI